MIGECVTHHGLELFPIGRCSEREPVGSALIVHPAAYIAIRKWSSRAPQPISASLPEWSVARAHRVGPTNRLSPAVISDPPPGLTVVHRRGATRQLHRTPLDVATGRVMENPLDSLAMVAAYVRGHWSVLSLTFTGFFVSCRRFAVDRKVMRRNRCRRALQGCGGHGGSRGCGGH